jgi:DNA-binding GntR family transcriptional regulator
VYSLIEMIISPAAPATSDITQATAVHHRLREDILSGRLPPGRKLKVQEVAAAYDAGPSPVREALAQLAAEGLAVRMEQRGFRVADAGPADLAELIRTRCLVEGVALRESIARGGVEWEDAIVVAEYRLARLARSADPGRFAANPAWEAQHRVFHRALLAACGAPPLLAFCERLREGAERYRALAGAVAYPGRDVAAEHAAIARAALDRDADRAAALLTEHYERTGEFLGLALRQRPRPGRHGRDPGQGAATG